MGAWAYFWGLLLLVTLLFYTALVIYVAIGGLKDIKQMFKTLGGESEEEADADAGRDEE